MTIIRSHLAVPALVLAATAMLTPLAALARDAAPEGPTATIKLDAASLAKGDDAGLIRSRIVAAAHRVCPPEDSSLQAQLLARECFAKAIRTAEARYAALRQAQLDSGFTATGKAALAAVDPKPVR
ncbi:UrcA family protein [Novosphingobium flavum]|uniref:UrcA family protein n=1 Tax=Novosphingobium aerophilum TaxID=2839843 RepID=A0A7X1F7X7_9SPHN|nr:UrcA family protein [Novosphingobium aerophilum]MBC2651894.1 UrcA family protein [Novosphingobium aerophilum]MBC2661707.1 UrcA family protein [Novosphingobium aerophilum]